MEPEEVKKIMAIEGRGSRVAQGSKEGGVMK